jgi:hypothetical protein
MRNAEGLGSDAALDQPGGALLLYRIAWVDAVDQDIGVD